MMKNFWKWSVRNAIDEGEQEKVIRELRMNGPIAEESWFGDEVTPGLFRDELFNGNGDIDVWLNSPGGDCIAASQIYTMLCEYKEKCGNVRVCIDGMAASAASVIAMAGTSVAMAPTGIMMIHDPMTCASGNREDMRDAIALLDEVKESIINAYEYKTGLSRDRISRMMSNTTWMNAEKAHELGFIDTILYKDGEQDAELKNSFSWSQHVSDVVLMNRITEEYAAKDNAEKQDDPEEPDIATLTAENKDNEANADDEKVNASELYERLNSKKYY